jgi:hypothetical protein
VKEYGGKTFDEHSVRTLDHELEISYFHMAFAGLTKRQDETFHYWRQTNLKRGIHPDALFKIEVPQGEHPFFLEIEKGKKNFDDLLKKLSRYAEYFDTEDCKKDWGFRKFRVIIVQKNDVRRQNLLKELHDKLPSRTFWLTTEELYKKKIGGEIFLTPKDFTDKTYSLNSL